MLPLILMLLMQTPARPAPAAPVQLPPEVANALRQTITDILVLTQTGTLCSAALRDLEVARSVVSKDIDDKRKDVSRIASDIAVIDRQLSRRPVAQERTELEAKRRALVDQGLRVDRELQQNPPSALMKRLAQVDGDIANRRQCVTKARADLEAYVTSLGVKAKP